MLSLACDAEPCLVNHLTCSGTPLSTQVEMLFTLIARNAASTATAQINITIVDGTRIPHVVRPAV